MRRKRATVLRTRQPTVVREDPGPGTSTEEEYLQEDAEEDRMMVEEQKKVTRDQGARTTRHSHLFKLLRWPLLVIFKDSHGSS